MRLKNAANSLDDPLCCDRRVLYRNSHIIQPEMGGEIMTDAIDSLIKNLEIERLEMGPDLLAQLMEDEIPLSETDAPTMIKTALFSYVDLHSMCSILNLYSSHQKQALISMLRREQGWAWEESSRDIWTRYSAFV